MFSHSGPASVQIVSWDSDGFQESFKNIGNSCILSKRAPGWHRSMQKGMDLRPGNPKNFHWETVGNHMFLQAHTWDRRNQRKRTEWCPGILTVSKKPLKTLENHAFLAAVPPHRNRHMLKGADWGSRVLLISIANQWGTLRFRKRWPGITATSAREPVRWRWSGNASPK